MANVDFSGKWLSTRGSVMILTQDAAGKLSGTYTSKAGSGGLPAVSGPIVGQAHGDQVAFFVDWWPASMTTWCGQLLTDDSGSDKLETVFANTKDVAEPDEPDMGWAGIRIGGDTFTKI